MTGPPQMVTYSRKPQSQAVAEPEKEVAPAPNILHRQPVAQRMMPTAEQMSDDE